MTKKEIVQTCMEKSLYQYLHAFTIVITVNYMTFFNVTVMRFWGQNELKCPENEKHFFPFFQMIKVQYIL